MPALLLDEMLSPRIARTLQQEGLDVVHVSERGLLGASDRVVFARAFDESRAVVTVNASDFRELATRVELHAGLVLIEPFGGLLVDEQEVLVRELYAALEGEDLVNRAAVVESDRSITWEDLPEPG